jgi:hypothetical protein
MLLSMYADDADAEGRPDDLEVTGIVEYSESEQGWVARVDWNAIRHASDVQPEDEDAKRASVPAARG